MANQIILYGIGGPEKAYAIVNFWTIFEKDLSVPNIRYNASRLRANPSVKKVFMISNRTGLKREFEEARRGNSIESYMIFKDILEREGMELMV